MREKTKNERYVEKWLKDNGFNFELLKQYNSKTVWSIRKEDVSDNFELPSGVEDIKAYMSMYKKTFEMKRETNELRKKLEGNQ